MQEGDHTASAQDLIGRILHVIWNQDPSGPPLGTNLGKVILAKETCGCLK